MLYHLIIPHQQTHTHTHTHTCQLPSRVWNALRVPMFLSPCDTSPLHRTLLADVFCIESFGQPPNGLSDGPQTGVWSWRCVAGCIRCPVVSTRRTKSCHRARAPSPAGLFFCSPDGYGHGCWPDAAGAAVTPTGATHSNCHPTRLGKQSRTFEFSARGTGSRHDLFGLAFWLINFQSSVWVQTRPLTNGGELRCIAPLLSWNLNGKRQACPLPDRYRPCGNWRLIIILNLDDLIYATCVHLSSRLGEK